nr:hypothetical protein [Carbonactinospora thermoautotrophica]
MTSGPPTIRRSTASSSTAHSRSGRCLVSTACRARRTSTTVSISSGDISTRAASIMARTYASVWSRPGTIRGWYVRIDAASASRLIRSR